MSFGPPRDGRATFQRLDRNPRWAGVPDLDEAGMRAVEAYFRAYGPATPDHVRYWLGEGLGVPRKRIQSWIAGFGDRLAAVDIDGESAYVLREDLEELAATPATTAVRLLPGYDQWVLGPGTADAHVVPPARRTLVSRQANIVIVGGVVSGTWSLTDDQVVVAWFAEAVPTPAGSAGRGGCAARHDPRSTPCGRLSRRRECRWILAVPNPPRGPDPCVAVLAVACVSRCQLCKAEEGSSGRWLSTPTHPVRDELLDHGQGRRRSP